MNKWLLLIVQQVLTVMTPDLRNSFVAFVNTMAENAKKTPNPWDDIFVGLLKTVLQIPDTE